MHLAEIVSLSVTSDSVGGFQCATSGSFLFLFLLCLSLRLILTLPVSRTLVITSAKLTKLAYTKWIMTK